MLIDSEGNKDALTTYKTRSGKKESKYEKYSLDYINLRLLKIHIYYIIILCILLI